MATALKLVPGGNTPTPTGPKIEPAVEGWTHVGDVSSGGRSTGVILTWTGSGPPVPRDSLRERFRLSPKQSEIALLLYTRRTNTEIADTLGIRISTVRNHVEMILLKLGVQSRNEVSGILDELAVATGLAAAMRLNAVRRGTVEE